MFKVSQSKIKQWRRCRAAYSFKYVDMLRKKVKARPLMVGSIIHEMIEAHANGDDPLAVLDAINLKEMKLFEAERELYGNIVQDIRDIMTAYFAYWEKNGDLVYIRHQRRNAEHSFELEHEGIILKGKIDAFAKRRGSKLRFLIEHKTFKRKPSEDSRWKNVQSSVYLKVCELMGWGHFDGVLWDYIGNRPPKAPEVLKSGKLSGRAITTLPSVVLRTLAENNLSTTHYQEYIKQVEANQSEYFFRLPTPVNQRVIDRVFAEFMATAHQVEELHGVDRSRSIDLHCDYCDYRSICQAELLDLDVEFVKEREFYVESEDQDTAVVEEAS